MKTLEILGAARKLIEKPENWTQGALARDRYGWLVVSTGPYACRWCLLGAIRRVGGGTPPPNQCAEIVYANDRMTHPEVLAWLDRAIALVERRSAAMTKKVFIVTAGSYSDYYVVAAFSTRKAAGAYVEQYNLGIGDPSHGADIQELVLDGEAGDVREKRFVVTIETCTGSCRWQTERLGWKRDPRREADASYCRGSSAKSFAHALKLAAEARQQWWRENCGQQRL